MNMLNTIIPKSDQLNFDDFIAGQSKTIKITNVSISAKEQPVALNYEGDNGKPFKPCKSMCRVLVHVWGPDAKLYVGRSLTLYGDAKVKFGGAEVGGIRISHMSDISSSITMALTATRANRKPFTVHPLKQVTFDDCLSGIELASTLEILEQRYKDAYKNFSTSEQRDQILTAKDIRKHELTTGESA